MAEEDRRVEPRTVLVGRGSGTTPQRIEALRERQAMLEKSRRPAPKKAFAAVLGARKPSSEDEAPEEGASPAPKAAEAPRPGLQHPSLRETFGRDKTPSVRVIIKG